MSHVLLINVRFHDCRYHGSGDWPPSPARLFQALVAGAARGGLSPSDQEALGWLETLPPPLIAAPSERAGQSFGFFVPNNDLDSVGGDVRRIGKIRTSVKRMRPRMFSPERPFLYAWVFENNEENRSQANVVAYMADRLYQLGRGVDMAWAVGEVIEPVELDRRLEAYTGAIYRPNDGREGITLDCLERGSLDSLCKRYQATGHRFTPTGQGKRLFTQAPKPRFQAVSYNSPITHLLFDLRDTVKAGSPFAPWPLARVVELVQTLRGRVDAEGTPEPGATRRLWDTLPDQRGEISSALIGRNATEADKHRRVRILPLPSIGHAHVNRDIRRVLVEVPPNCPLRKDDISWAFSGLEIASTGDETTRELLSNTQLVPAVDRSMLEHYGLGSGESARVWRSVTPLALPEGAGRRRIEAARLRAEAKDGPERLAEHQCATGAVLHALRHAGVRASATSVRMQREPFEAKELRVEFFSPGTRFAKERLWHAEITFATPVQGPLVLGDGRYAGLGLMRPVASVIGVHAFRIVGGLADGTKPATISAALRRAVMARVQDVLGLRKPLPTFFSGHERNGAPARGNAHRHLAFITDLARDRLLIVAPHMMEHRHPTPDEKRHLSVLAASLVGLAELRAGGAGRLELTSSTAHADDRLLAPALRWESVTEYRVTRHPKRTMDHQALVADAASELARRNLPRPTRIEPIQCTLGSHGGITGRMRIEFATAVSGPILIGQTCHSGGGLFIADEQR
ncbi:MAG: type I-U CRISPR-associated protein Cas5/Cas6 [Betaproteobacteria bacterium]|nr:type I-U CRISPR-associated protein Cas5/Cas6 [Betaproteobacteria bacterium]